MRYIIPCVEQLDRAAEELRNSNPVNSRLALILIDNAVELTCHRRCEEIILRDGHGGWLHKPKYRRRQRRRAMSKFFNQKLSFLLDETLLSSDEQQFLLIAHKCRNEAYHIGLRDDSIIWSIAVEYHTLACELFGRLKPGWMGSTSDDPYTERVNHRLKTIGVKTPWPNFPDLEKLAASLADERPPVDRSLAEVLSEALLRELDALDREFHFLVADNPLKLDASEILSRIQYFDQLTREMEKTDLFPADVRYQVEYKRVVAQTRENWSPRYDRVPLANWRHRARELAKEDNPLKALKKFDSIRLDKDYLAEVVGAAASDLDSYIQMQMDLARGK